MKSIAVLLALLLASFFLPRAASGESVPVTHRILIVNSYHAGMPFSDEEVRGIRESLPKSTDIFIEYMDTKRLQDAVYLDMLARIYTMKYATKHFNAILALDNDATEFLLRRADRIFAGIPVVFCGVNNPPPDMLDGHPQFTGVIESMDIEESLQLGRKLYPAARQVLAITDNTTTGKSNRRVLEAIAGSGRLGLPIRFLDTGPGLDLPELITLLRRATGPSLVYYADFFRDRHGHALNPDTVIQQVTDNAPGPVLVHNGAYIGHGVLGGKINSGYQQGRLAAGLVRRIWAGEKPSDIPMVRDNINTITLDARVLQRWNIPEQAVHAIGNATIVNKPPDPYNGYGWLILSAGIFAILEGLLILWLLRLLDQQRTLRRQAMRSEARFRDLFDLAPVPMCHVLDDGRILALNRAFTATLGYTLDDIPNIRIWWDKAYPDRANHPDARQRWAAACTTHREDTAADPVEVRITDSSGRVHDMLITSTCIDQSVLACYFDITELRQAVATLRRSEEKFMRFFQLAPECVIIIRRRDSVIIDVNDAVEDFCGYTRQEVLGRSTGDLKMRIQLGTDRDLFFDELALAPIRNREYTFRHRNGSQRSAVMSATRLVFEGEDSLLCITHDITDYKKIQEMMVQTEKMISMGGIAAGIAHEINNPLGIIMQGAQTLTQRLRTDFPRNIRVAEEIGLEMALLDRYIRQRELDVFVADILDAARRAAAIIRHMLDFSRRSESHRKVCSLEQIIDRALGLAASEFDLDRSFDFKKIRVRRQISPDLPMLNCTETEIEQVLINLFRNAAQAMASLPDRDPAITIRLDFRDGMLHLEIEDNGPGMPPAVRRRIFEPFFTTKPPGSGTGLGLSVSYFIITQGHDGRLDVRSRPGSGTTFIIDLPAWSPA